MVYDTFYVDHPVAQHFRDKRLGDLVARASIIQAATVP